MLGWIKGRLAGGKQMKLTFHTNQGMGIPYYEHGVHVVTLFSAEFVNWCRDKRFYQSQMANDETRVPLGSNIITLFQGPNAWMAHFSGPYADFVRRAFGTEILPTAFTIQATEADVYAAMVQMNPGFIVMLEAQC
jgi:hypothetical protein